jgi:hypothetical protein
MQAPVTFCGATAARTQTTSTVMGGDCSEQGGCDPQATHGE